MKLLRAMVAVFLFPFFLMDCAWASVYLQAPPANLSWPANPEPDVVGYEIYRSSRYDGSYAKVSPGIVNTSWWQDYNLSEGVTYYYKVQATDSYGNKSAFSGASDAVVVDSTPPSVLADMADGTYKETIHVSLTADETCTIYYTTDGTFPTSGSSFYSSPITISQTTTLRFYAVDLAGNWSTIQTKSYVIDSGVNEIVLLKGPIGTPTPVGSGERVSCSVEASDSAGHALSYHWSATGGEFEAAASANPVWTAPANWSETSAFYEIMITITCSEGKQAFASFFEEVLPGGNHAPIADAGEDRVVRGQVQVTLEGCGSYDPDGGPSSLTYSWRQIGENSLVSIEGASSCSASVDSPSTDGVLEFELSVGDGLATTTDTVRITVDTQPPVLLPQSLLPYPNQGMDASAGTPSTTCFRAKLSDNFGLDLSEETLQQFMSVVSIQTVDGKSTTLPMSGTVSAIEAGGGETWLQFVPDYTTEYGSGLPYGLKVLVTITATDLAGNVLVPYSYTFRIEDSAPALPAQQYSEDPNQELGDTMWVILQEGQYEGARMEFLDTIPVLPYFTNIANPPKIRGAQNYLLLHLQPAMVFHDPLKLYVPVQDVKNIRKLKVYHYDPNPAVGWQEAQVGDGWLVYREDHLRLNPPVVELWVSHF